MRHPETLRAVAVHPSDEAAPRVLLFTIQTSHTGSCRLPKMFSEAGFVVGVEISSTSAM